MDHETTLRALVGQEVTVYMPFGSVYGVLEQEGVDTGRWYVMTRDRNGTVVFNTEDVTGIAITIDGEHKQINLRSKA